MTVDMCSAALPSHGTETVQLRDGERVDVRTIRSDDARRLVEFSRGLGSETIYRRFLHARGELSRSEAAHYAAVEPPARDALVACARDGPADGRIVAVARYAMRDATIAEGGLVVADAYQGRGLGSALLRRLVTLAERRGFESLHGTVLADNGRMLRLLRSTGYPLTLLREGGAYETRLDLKRGRLDTPPDLMRASGEVR